MRVPGDALDVVGVALQAQHALRLGNVPHDALVVDGAGDHSRAPGRPRQILDVVRVPAEHRAGAPGGRIAVLVRARAGAPDDHLAGVASGGDHVAPGRESNAVHRLVVRGEGLDVPHVGVAVRVRLDAPQLDFLVRAAGREESVGGVEVHRKHGILPVPQHLQRLHLHRGDGDGSCAARVVVAAEGSACFFKSGANFENVSRSTGLSSSFFMRSYSIRLWVPQASSALPRRAPPSTPVVALAGCRERSVPRRLPHFPSRATLRSTAGVDHGVPVVDSSRGGTPHPRQTRRRVGVGVVDGRARPRPPRDGEPRRVSRALASRRGFHVRQRGGAPRRRPLPQDTPRQHVLPTSSVGSARRARGVRGARMAPRPVRRRRPRRGRRPPDRVRRRPDRSWLRLVAPSVRPVPARGFSHTHALSPDPTRR